MTTTDQTDHLLILARIAETEAGRGLILSSAADIIDLRHTEGTSGLRQALRRFSADWLDRPVVGPYGRLPSSLVLVGRIKTGLGLAGNHPDPDLGTTVDVLADLHRAKETGFCATPGGRAAVLAAAAVIVADHHRLRIRSGMGSSPFTIPDRLRQLAQVEHQQAHAS